MQKIGLLLIGCLCSVAMLSGQSYAFGIKGGMTIGVQQWNSFEQDPLFKYHGIAFIESAPEDEAFAVFAQLGYHVKGSAIRNRNFVNPRNNEIFRLPTQEFQFHNISLTAGGKQKYDFGIKSKAYYLIGVRGDYTVDTNLEEYEDAFNISAIFPVEPFVNRFNFGVTVGGGLEFPFSELIGGILEVTVNPDFSRQYEQPQINNIINPFTSQNRTIPERLIRNITFEVSLGLRFLNKVIYID